MMLALSRSRPLRLGASAFPLARRTLACPQYDISRLLSSQAADPSSVKQAAVEPKAESEAVAPEAAAEAGAADSAATDAGGTPSGSPSDPVVDAVAELQVRVDELQAKVDEKHDQLLRSIAETANVRTRSAVERENASKYAVSKFAKGVLDVADNLSRAMESVPEALRSSDEHPELKGLFEGVQMTETCLLKVLGENGMTRMEPMGLKFDPNQHNAMFEAPDPTKEAGTIMHVASAGFMLNDRCLRAAGVGIVAKPPAA